MSAQGNWGWRPRQADGIWRHGCAWTKPLFAAVPWITLTLLLALFAFIGDLVLPGASAGEETLVFFDDARYSLSDESSVLTLKERLGARSLAEPSNTFLLLADRRVPAGDIIRLVGIARESGLSRVQIAERRE